MELEEGGTGGGCVVELEEGGTDGGWNWKVGLMEGGGW